jgi:hypothetical protein
MIPTTAPTPIPTVEPTPVLRTSPEAVISMTLFGMDLDVKEIPRIYETLVSQHVQTFWRSLPDPYNPLFIGNVTTTLEKTERVSKEDLSQASQGNRRATGIEQLFLQRRRQQQQQQDPIEQYNMTTTTNDTEVVMPVDGNNTNFTTSSSPSPMPTVAPTFTPTFAPTAVSEPIVSDALPLVIQYSQTIDYELRQQSEENSVLVKSSLFLAPFEISPWDFLIKLAAVSNNSGIVVLHDIQILTTDVGPDEEEKNEERTKNIAISVVVVVVMSLLMVGGYILYLVKCKEPMHEHNQHPMERNNNKNNTMLGTVVGVHSKNSNYNNSNHDVVISESYDDGLYYETPTFRDVPLSSGEGPSLSVQQKQKQYIMMESLPSMRSSSYHQHHSANDYASAPLAMMDSETDPDQYVTRRQHSRSLSAPLESHLDGNLDYDNGAFLSLPPPSSSVIQANEASSTEEIPPSILPATAGGIGGSSMERPEPLFAYPSPPPPPIPTPMYGSRTNSSSVVGEHLGDSRQSDDDRGGVGGYDGDGGASSSEDRETNDEEHAADGVEEEPSIPFMSGFQLQIEDLE